MTKPKIDIHELMRAIENALPRFDNPEARFRFRLRLYEELNDLMN